MGTVIRAFPELTQFGSIGNIPVWRSPEQEAVLRAVCQQMFAQKGDKQVVIITKRDEVAVGIENTDDILEFYRTQREIRSILLMAPAVVEDLTSHYAGRNARVREVRRS